MLPFALLYLTLLPLIIAQQQIPLNNSTSFSTSSSVLIPSTSDILTVTIALCASPTTSPRFFLSNNVKDGIPSAASLGQPGIFEIQVAVDGIGTWTGSLASGGIVAATSVGSTPYEIGVSSTGSPIHLYQDSIYALFGDSTANQALLFSPVFQTITPDPSPSFPNYTLPSAQSPFLSSILSPSSNPQLSLALFETSVLSAQPLALKTGCALKALNSTGTVRNQTNWLKDNSGWRSQWLVEGLKPLTNYTTYSIQDGNKVSGPMYFVTKSASFNCPLISSLPFCPTVSWSVPLPPPPEGVYDSTNLDPSISTPILQYLANFTAMLNTFACGRDIYSPLRTCADCAGEYRRWLCSVSFPRCGEATSSSSSSSTVPTALLTLPPTTVPRSTNFPPQNNTYTELLPCIEVCDAADRACPTFIGFRCPQLGFNARASYGVGYIDSGDMGDIGDGLTGAAQDRYGNVWCNSGGGSPRVINT